MKYKYKYILTGYCVSVMLLGAVVYLQPKITAPTPKRQTIVEELHPVYAANFSDDRILVGASHNIFVGRVLGLLGTHDYGLGPETQFSVQVVEDIKGNLSGSVTVDQEGGYENGVLSVVEGDVGGSDGGGENNNLLRPGYTYLLATRYNSENNWYTLNSFPAASKLISQDSNLSTPQLQVLAENDARVKQLQAAYPHEILLAADVAHNLTLNSYQSLHQASPPPPAIMVQDSAPTISSLTGIAGSTSTTMTWITNKPATSQLFFGSTTAMGESAAPDTALVTNHTMVTSGLTPGTTYYYEVQSKDASGTISTSAQQSFMFSGQSNSAQPLGTN